MEAGEGAQAGDPADWFADCVVPVREDLIAAHAELLERIAGPGTWWTGTERVAIAAEVRAARACAFCRLRKDALSPKSISGVHDRDDTRANVLTEPAVDAVHRIITDATRLSPTYLAELAEAGIDDARYVELLGIAVAVLSVDEVCRGLAVPLHPLPRPVEGEPSRMRPVDAVAGDAWVPMLPPRRPASPNEDLWPARAPNVIRAMSLVPDAVRDLLLLSNVQYLPMHQAMDMSRGRTLLRSQIELVAGRVSAVNECFY